MFSDFDAILSIGDLAKKPLTGLECTTHSATRNAYAYTLAYALKGSITAALENQFIGIVGGCYCMVTVTDQGLYAQPVYDVLLPIEHFELVRELY